MNDLRKLGLLVLAAMALAGFIGTTTASATGGKFTTSNPGGALATSTVSNHVFIVTGAKGECKVSSFSGNAAANGSTEQTVTPFYKECTFAGFPATVDTTGCKYKFTATTDANNHAEVHLESCTSGGVTITVDNLFAKCVAHVKNQTVKGINYFNSGGGTDIIVKATANTIHDEVTVSTGLCPLTVGTHTNASYTGESTVQVGGGTVQWSK